jgi:hypothetical protein
VAGRCTDEYDKLNDGQKKSYVMINIIEDLDDKSLPPEAGLVWDRDCRGWDRGCRGLVWDRAETGAGGAMTGVC